jgi:hypothetical protein
MAMMEKDGFPKNMVWTGLHALPAGLTFTDGKFDVLCF